MRLLWHVGYWDGPLSGICLLDGRRHWFRIKDGTGDPDTEDRKFEIIHLDDEQILAEEERHALFVQYVGSHCDYDEQNKRQIGDAKSQEEWRKFYELPALGRNYTEVLKVVSESELREVAKYESGSDLQDRVPIQGDHGISLPVQE